MPAKLNFSEYNHNLNLSTKPYPVALLTQPLWYDFIKQNGYISLAQKLFLKVESASQNLKCLWEQFTPNESVFDLWEVRKAFADGYNFEPYFLTIFEKRKGRKNILGVLPLSIDNEENPVKTDKDDDPKHIWYGSNWPEDNNFFVKDPELIPLLLFAAPDSMKIDCIRPLPELEFMKELPGFKLDKEKKYFLNLSKYATLDDYLTILKKKKRYNILRDRKKIQSLHPQIVINRYDHLEQLFQLNIRRFREKYNNDPEERSTFENDRQKNAFRNLVRNAGQYRVRMISTILRGEVVAVEMGLHFQDKYFALNAGTAVSQYSGIGVFSNLLVLEDAIKLGCNKIDFLEGAYNWKDSWQLNHYYQYQFTK